MFRALRLNLPTFNYGQVNEAFKPDAESALSTDRLNGQRAWEMAVLQVLCVDYKDRGIPASCLSWLFCLGFDTGSRVFALAFFWARLHVNARATLLYPSRIRFHLHFNPHMVWFHATHPVW